MEWLRRIKRIRIPSQLSIPRTQPRLRAPLKVSETLAAVALRVGRWRWSRWSRARAYVPRTAAPLSFFTHARAHRPSQLLPPTMVFPLMTPYVTPHILHKNYAQASDNEIMSNRPSFSSLFFTALCSRPHTVIGRDLEYFSQAGFDMDKITLKRNAPVALLYEDAIRNEGAIISSSGALINFSGKKTGRSPKDKRIVYEDTSKDDIWWGSVNIKMDERESPPPTPTTCIPL